MRITRIVTLLLSIVLTSPAFSKNADSDWRYQLKKYEETLKHFHASPEHSFQNYVSLRRYYDSIDKPNLPIRVWWRIAQQQAAVDTFFGRYIDAENRLYAVRPNYSAPKECNLGDFIAKKTEPSLKSIIKKHDVILINESHTRLSTRAFNFSLLPILKEHGVTHLAFESLSQTYSIDEEKGMMAFPRDNFKDGYYAREPIMALLLREAVKLGFKITNYDQSSQGKRQEREVFQAKNLSRYIRENNIKKMAIFTGYSHIYKEGGWMAQYLQEEIKQSIFSIDQVQSINGCRNFNPMFKGTYLGQGQKKSQYWSAKPNSFDLSIIHQNHIDEKTQRPAWLDLNGVRSPVAISDTACKSHYPCLVSAFAQNQSLESVPIDRRYIASELEERWLYLPKGQYTYTVETLQKHKKGTHQLQVTN